ncbi:MAG: AIM24 family protein, partial [Lachnospiraceae bacterium]|nr:AIM24 family protein [Lachnospiraceae bacterium]
MKYQVIGGNLPAALVQLEAGQGVYCENGAMSWMDEGIEMKTESGGLGKMFSRAMTGESLFLNHYVAQRPGEIAFASSFPGEIRGYEL